MKLGPKTTRFIEVIAIAVVAAALKAVAANLGASGLVSTSTAGFITALIAVVEQQISGTGKALFGAITISK